MKIYNRKMVRHLLETTAKYGTLHPGNADFQRELKETGYDQRIEEYTNYAISLIESGYLVKVSDKTPHIPRTLTMQGWALLEELSYPKWLWWLKNNWFPAIVAAVTIAVSVTAIIVELTKEVPMVD